MSFLDEFDSMGPHDRKWRLSHPDTAAALDALGHAEAIRWLEERLASPVWSDWGTALYLRRPAWQDFERWMQRSKEHCLAAFDALEAFADVGARMFGEKPKPRLPDGADPKAINAAIERALEAFCNPRLRQAAEKLRRAWPRGRRRRHRVRIPHGLAEIADVVLQSDDHLVKSWHESLAVADEPVRTPFDAWKSLIEFAEQQGLVAIVDWRAPADEVLASVRSLPLANSLPLDSSQFSADNETAQLLGEIGSAIESCAFSLVSLGHGADDYPLAIVPAGAVDKLAEGARSFDDEAIRVDRLRG